MVMGMVMVIEKMFYGFLVRVCMIISVSIVIIMVIMIGILMRVVILVVVLSLL